MFVKDHFSHSLNKSIVPFYCIAARCNWSPWSSCEKKWQNQTCGNGQRTRERSFEYGVCLSNTIETKECNFSEPLPSCPSGKIHLFHAKKVVKWNILYQISVPVPTILMRNRVSVYASHQWKERENTKCCIKLFILLWYWVILGITISIEVYLECRHFLKFLPFSRNSSILESNIFLNLEWWGKANA